MNLEFFKIQSQGNDYLFFDLRNKAIPEDLGKLSKKISDRHFGVGADGIVLILDDTKSNAFMRIFNADGSEAKMCGSALMSSTQYLANDLNKNKITINTNSGKKNGYVSKDHFVTVNMGQPEFNKNELTIGSFTGNVVQIGNPHFVTFLPDLEENLAKEYGPQIEANKNFPGGINIEFAKIISRKLIEIQIWERGSGATLACGTGSCAAVFAGISKGSLDKKVTVKVPGGKVVVELEESRQIKLTGKPEFVFSGNYKL